MQFKASMFKDEKMVPTERLEMPWRDNTNKVDCGIFTMRHMETYFGNGLTDWESQLRKEDSKQIANMRVKYCHSIIDNSWNEVKNNVYDMMSKAIKKK